MLEPFVAYRPFILTLVAITIGWAWVSVLYRRQKTEKPRFITPVFWLGAATIVFGVALFAPTWEKEVSQSLWKYWVQSR